MRFSSLRCFFPCRATMGALVGLLVLLLLACPATAADQLGWIWSPEHAMGAVPRTACHFRKEFTVLSPQRGSLFAAAEDRYELFVNGRRVGAGGGRATLTEHDISRFLVSGRNLVAFRVTNTHGSTAGLAARIEVRDRNRQSHRYVTDDSWMTHLNPLPFWFTPLYNDARWDMAQLLGYWEPIGSTGESLARLQAPQAQQIPGRFPRELESAGSESASPRPLEIAGTEGTSLGRVPARVTVADEDQAPSPAAVPAPQDPDPEQDPEQELPFRVAAEFEVESLLDHELTDSLLALDFNEFGHIIASREGGELLLIHQTDDPQQPLKVRVYGDQVRDCRGILCLNGDVYVTGDGPEGRGLYRLQDQSRDGRLDHVETLLVLPAEDAETGPQGVALGTDGFLYVLVGSQTQLPSEVSASSPYRMSERDRADGPRRVPGGALLRMDVHGRQVQVVAGGLRDATSAVFNLQGDGFTVERRVPDLSGWTGAQAPALHHLVTGGEYGWRHDAGAWPEFYLDRLPGILDTTQSFPAGMAVYQHYAFPADYHDTLFIADWAGGRILNVRLRPHGASYTAQSDVFLELDSLSIRDLAVGPEGWLYFVTGGYGTAGGLYRVRVPGQAWSQAAEDDDWLGAVIRQPQPQAAWSRQRIATWKTKLDEDWEPSLRGVALSSANPWQYRTRVLDLLQLFGPAPDVEFLVEVAAAENEQVRSKAAELLGLHACEAAQTGLIRLLSDRDRRVRRRAAESLLRGGHQAPREALEPLLASDDRHEAWGARRLLERLPREKWVDQLREQESHRLQVQAALALLNVEPDGSSVPRMLESLVRSMDGFVTDRDFTDMLRVLEVAVERGAVPPVQQTQLRELVAAEYPSADPQMNRILVQLVVGLQVPGVLERCLVHLASPDVGPQEKVHLALHLPHIPGHWSPERRLQVLDVYQQNQDWSRNADAGVLKEAARALVETMSHDELLATLAQGAEWPEAALRLLYHMPEELDTASFEALVRLDEQLLGSQDPTVLRLRIGMVAVLTRSGDPASLEYLRSLWDRDPERRPALALGLAQWPSEENWSYLMRSLPVLDDGSARDVLVTLRHINKAPDQPEYYRQVILRGLRLGERGGVEAVDLLEFWTDQETPGGREQDLEQQLKAWQAWYAEQWPEAHPAEMPAYQASGSWEYEELLRYLIYGDGRFGSASRGGERFEQSCAVCHRVGDLGQDAAPDLTWLSRRAMRKEILESILFPSHFVVEEYRKTTIIMQDGRERSGRLVRQNESQQLVLAKPDGRVVTLDRADVQQMIPQPDSPMPEGLLDDWQLEEIADLFAFLLARDREQIVDRPEPTILR